MKYIISERQHKVLVGEQFANTAGGSIPPANRRLNIYGPYQIVGGTLVDLEPGTSVPTNSQFAISWVIENITSNTISLLNIKPNLSYTPSNYGLTPQIQKQQLGPKEQTTITYFLNVKEKGQPIDVSFGGLLQTQLVVKNASTTQLTGLASDASQNLASGYNLPIAKIKLPSFVATKLGISDLDPHVAMTVLQIGTAFIPLVGPFISTGIGLADAYMYYKEGDTKTAGLVGVFSLLPGIGGLAKLGFGKFSPKVMGEIGRKISMGEKLTVGETQIANKVAQNRTLIQNEINKIGAEAGINVAKQNVKQQVAIQSAANTTKSAGKALAPYVGTGVAYSKGYDYVQSGTPKAKAQEEGLDWAFVKDSFGSSGSEEDNKKLNQAWDKGWRPGQIVPKEFQTEKYLLAYNDEKKKMDELEKLIAANQ